MFSHRIHLTRSNAVAFLLGLSASLALTMCADTGAQSGDAARLDEIEARLPRWRLRRLPWRRAMRHRTL